MTKDKKQMIVLGVLVLAVLAIGAFQFMGPKPKPTVTDDDKKVKKQQVVAVNENKPDPVAMAIEQLLNPVSSPRDPFVPQAVLIEDPPEGQQPVVNQPPVQQPDTEIGGGFKPVQPPGMGPDGEIGPGLQPDKPLGSPYTLRGVMLGRKNLAMIELENGKQILVQEGEVFGADITVLAISEKEVVIKQNGKVKTLGLLGGN